MAIWAASMRWKVTPQRLRRASSSPEARLHVALSRRRRVSEGTRAQKGRHMEARSYEFRTTLWRKNSPYPDAGGVKRRRRRQWGDVSARQGYRFRRNRTFWDSGRHGVHPFLRAQSRGARRERPLGEKRCAPQSRAATNGQEPIALFCDGGRGYAVSSSRRICAESQLCVASATCHARFQISMEAISPKKQSDSSSVVAAQSPESIRKS